MLPIEPTLVWDRGAIVTLDQTVLPRRRVSLRIETVDALIEAIQRLAIRGAPALGIAGAFGVALAAHQHRSADGTLDLDRVRRDAARLAEARPTAVNLTQGVARALGTLPAGSTAVLAEATAMVEEDHQINQAAADRAADLTTQLCSRPRLRVLTHCHTGGLATAGWGTALGAIRQLAAAGRIEVVLATETRPLLQGARLTVWELREAGIPHRLLVDSAASTAVAAGMVDCVLVGADRIASNGDVANKVGTYPLALAAARHQVPFVVVAPESTIDSTVPDGAGITIEQRPAAEVTSLAGTSVSCPGTATFNPAFDITPSHLITAVVTERQVIWHGAGAQPTSVWADLARRLRELTTVVSDFPRVGVQFLDLAGIYREPGVLATAARALGTAFGDDVSHVVAVESRGFPLGTAVALAVDKPLVLVRKAGKLPGPVRSVSYDLEYGQDILEMQDHSLPAGSRALVVDDVLATGGTLAAVAKLVTECGATVAGIGVLYELPSLHGAARLQPNPVVSLAKEPA